MGKRSGVGEAFMWAAASVLERFMKLIHALQDAG